MSGSFGNAIFGNTPAQNGLGVNAANNTVELGGDLTRPTIINTDIVNVLKLTGIQAGDPATDSLAVLAPDGTIKFVSTSGLPDFWRQTVSGALPDAATDAEEDIRHLGGVGIGGAATTDAMPTVTTPSAVNSYLHLSSNAAHRGQLMFGSSPVLYYMARTLPTAVSDYVDVVSWTSGSQANVFALSVNVSDGAFAASKHYIAALNYNATGGAWRVLRPLSDGGAFNSNNYEVLINVSNRTVTLRLRRTAGATAGTARIYLQVYNDPSTVLTESVAGGTDATAYTELSSTGAEWHITGNTGTTPSAYNDNGAQASNFIGTLDNQPVEIYTNANNANAKSDLRLYTTTPTGAGITAPSDILHVRRNGQTGIVNPQILTVALGKWFADSNGRTRADFKLLNGAGSVADFIALSLFSQGGVGINGNGTAATWSWAAGGGITRGNGGTLLGLMGANASPGSGPNIAAWTAADTFPLYQQFNYTHDNLATVYDGYYDGAWKAAHTTRPYMIYKLNGALNFYGQAALPAAAGNAWTLDLMGRWRYAGATLAGGELDFNNIVKNRRIVLFDNNAASDHQFYGFGINGAILRYQVDSAGASHVFYYGTAAATSQEIGRLNNAGLTLQIGTGLKPGGGAWGAVSDKRVKKLIKPVKFGLAELLKLKPVSFKYNGKAGTTDDDKQYYSLIAQDVQSVLPDFVEEHPIEEAAFEEMSSKDKALFSDKVLLGLKEGLTNFEALLINAVQELADKNQKLEERILALEGK